MPSVALTAAQREEKRMAARAARLSDGLAAFKNREHLSNKDVGKALGICDRVVARILDADITVRLPIKSIWKLEEIARMAESEVGK